MTKGFYCLIQYCPDFSRAEALNVGVMLFQPEPLAVAVRVVDDVGPAMRRLGPARDKATVLDDVQSMGYRLVHEPLRTLEDLERFVRSRGNQIQLTMPRPMAIDGIEREVESMFAELVDAARPGRAADKEPTPLLRTFAALATRLPDQVFLDREFHVKGLGIPIHADYAWRNGQLNIVREMPMARDLEAVRFQAMGMSKEGELVRDLEEGTGKLVVVSTAAARTKRAVANERAFGDMLDKLQGATFVSSDRVVEFTKTVEAELAGH